MKRLLCTLAATVAWTALYAGVPLQGLADAPTERVALSDAELDDMRGGFLVADGIKLDFAATIKTFLDGQLALETNLVWTPTGPVSTQTVGDNVASMAGVDVASLAAAAGLRGLSLPDALTLAGGDASGGATALVQQATGSSLANLVLTTASNQTIRQQIDVNLTLPGFDINQQNMALGLLGMRLSADGATATIGALN